MVNHYKVLGLPSKCTQAEVKTAFYRLSKVFHPDVSDQSEEANVKFRQITAAYEVLGNIKLRKLYDKGILPHNTIYPDEPGMDFEKKESEIKSPFRKERYQPASGRTNIYDFDQWARLHYGSTMSRRTAAKDRWQSREAVNHEIKANEQTDNLVGFALLAIGLLTGLHFLGTSNHDEPKAIGSENKKTTP